MTTTTKVALLVMAMTACGVANATVTPSADGAPGAGLIGNYAHTVSFATNAPNTPVTFTDGTVNVAALSGQTLNDGDVIVPVGFKAKMQHVYQLSADADGVKYSFSGTNDTVSNVLNKHLVVSTADTDAYVLITKDGKGALASGPHSYTFTVTDYNS
ncbi:hypothetical protein NLW46_005059 [Salmonella enterica]|nr:hypothetical protein [Salmonella enterica]